MSTLSPLSVTLAVGPSFIRLRKFPSIYLSREVRQILRGKWEERGYQETEEKDKREKQRKLGNEGRPSGAPAECLGNISQENPFPTQTRAVDICLVQYRQALYARTQKQSFNFPNQFYS